MVVGDAGVGDRHGHARLAAGDVPGFGRVDVLVGDAGHAVHGLAGVVQAPQRCRTAGRSGSRRDATPCWARRSARGRRPRARGRPARPTGPARPAPPACPPGARRARSSRRRRPGRPRGRRRRRRARSGRSARRGPLSAAAWRRGRQAQEGKACASHPDSWHRPMIVAGGEKVERRCAQAAKRLHRSARSLFSASSRPPKALDTRSVCAGNSRSARAAPGACDVDGRRPPVVLQAAAQDQAARLQRRHDLGGVGLGEPEAATQRPQLDRAPRRW